MDFINNVGKKLGNAAKTATKKSEGLVEITKTNLSIGSEEDKIKKLFTEMGKELYARFANGESFDEPTNGKCAEIKAVEDNIETLKEKVRNLKGHNSSPESITECNSDCNTDCNTEKKDEANYRLDNISKKDSE
jgi:hypothetical protein